MILLNEKTEGQYRTINASLSREINWFYGISRTDDEFQRAVSNLILGYARYYGRQNIHISMTVLSPTSPEGRPDVAVRTFLDQAHGQFINIIGPLAPPFDYFLLSYSLDISENIATVRNIQNVFLLSAIIFSAITAFALHFILQYIFRPLHIVAKVSREIAGGQYDERINIKGFKINGENEIAHMAFDFNKMAETIERQIKFLEDEATSKQQFVDNFAHEIRTPLTSIYGYAEYMQKTLMDENEVIESAGHIINEADHMRNISNSLLELATLRNYTPVVREIPAALLLNDISKTLEKTLRRKNIKLICEADFAVIYGQEDLIRSLILNLCTNAINACCPGEGVVSVKINEASITVGDNGSGIPRESIDKVTTPFYRADKARSRGQGYSGAGLGLTLCKQIAQAHAATLNIESTIGEGTTVTVVFLS